jgi:hypothetical protein
MLEIIKYLCMKKIEKFQVEKLESLRTRELSGISSIVGGKAYPSHYTSSNGSGTDTVFWGAGETGLHMIVGRDACYYCDITFDKSDVPPGTRIDFIEGTGIYS